MGNDDRRSGMGFGNQHKVDSGARPNSPDYEEDNGESTRAMSIEDVDAPPPTEFVRGPGPAPRPAMARPAPRPMPRQAPPPPSSMDHGGDEEDAATRMLDAMPDDLPAPGARAPQPVGRALDLKVVSGPDRGKIHHIGEGDSLVGRGLDCQIVLADPAVSRKHFQLRRSGDQVVLEDLGGPNGTKVNSDKRARQVLEPGDQIEVGMSVLEYQVDGMGKRKDSRGAPRDDDRSMRQVAEPRMASQGKTGGGPGKIIAIAAVLVLLLVGGGVTAWLVMGKKSADKTAAATGGEADGDLGALLEKAKKQIADKEFAAAVATLKKAQEVDKAAPEIAPLKRQAGQEATAQKTLQEGKEAKEAGNNEEALAKLTSEDIGKESVFRAEADLVLVDVKKAIVVSKLDEAKKALAAADNAKADAAVKAVLELDPDNGDAKMLQGQLAGAAPAHAPPLAAGADAGATADAGAAAVAKPAEGKPADAAKAEPAKAEPVKAEAAKKADFAGGLSAYGSRQWSAAVQTFEAIAGGPFGKDEKKKAAAYAAGVKRVEAAWNKAQSANGKAAAAAWKDAREADSDVDGHHKAFLTDQVIKAYVAAAKAARTAGNCGDAVENAEVANDYSASGSNAEAKSVIDGCKADGKNLLQQAEQALAAGQSAKAKELAARADKILGSDPLAQKAKEILKKASAAGRGEE